MTNPGTHDPACVPITLKRRTPEEIVEILTTENSLLRAENYNLRHIIEGLKAREPTDTGDVWETVEILENDIKQKDAEIAKLTRENANLAAEKDGYRHQIPLYALRVAITGNENIPYGVNVVHGGSGTVLRGGFHWIRDAEKWIEEHGLKLISVTAKRVESEVNE